MTILVDASVLVAITLRDDDVRELGDRLALDRKRIYCTAGEWEAAVAISKRRGHAIDATLDELRRLCADLSIHLVPIGAEESRLALDAFARYGKGSGHPARLNMGDCFAHACARTNGARLLYKGDDFVHTDLA